MITFIITSLILFFFFIYLLLKIWKKSDILPFFSVFAAVIIYLFIGTFVKDSMKIVTSANEAMLTETGFFLSMMLKFDH